MAHFHNKVIQAQLMSHDQRCPWHTAQPGKEEVSWQWLESRENTEAGGGGGGGGVVGGSLLTASTESRTVIGRLRKRAVVMF